MIVLVHEEGSSRCRIAHRFYWNRCGGLISSESPIGPAEEHTDEMAEPARALALFDLPGGAADASGNPSMRPRSSFRLGSTDDLPVAPLPTSDRPWPPSDAEGAEEFDVQFLALASVRGLGPNSLRALILRYGALPRVWDSDPEEILSVLSEARVPSASGIVDALRMERPSLLDRGRRQVEKLTRSGFRLIGMHDPAFPRRLLGREDAPLWLFVEGNLGTLNNPPLVAVVGTRHPTDAGREATTQLTRLVLEDGLGVVSGLADGIDQVAHAAAARHSAPQVAVLGTGIEMTFPASNRDLRDRIVGSGGTVVTEYLPSVRYGQANFVQRNRVQAALASAVCPVEGKAQSGTAHTVRFAASYGRPLFAVRRGDLAPTNALPDVVASMGAPVFDIASEDGRAALREFLGRIEGQRVTPLPPPEDHQQFVARAAVDKFRTLRSYHDLSLAAKRRLLEEAAEALGTTLAEVTQDGR